MESGGRNIRPGQGRVAAAWRAGLLSGSQTLTAGIFLIGAAGALYLFGEWEARSMVEMVRGGMIRALQSPSLPSELSREIIAGWLTLASPFLAVSIGAALIAAFLPAARYLGRRGHTAVPLPRRPMAGAYVSILRSFSLLVFLALAAYALRGKIGAAFGLAYGDADAGARLGSAAVGLIFCAGAVAVLCGAAEISIGRYLAWRSLHLTSAEARREQRATGGDRAVRAEQRRRSRVGVES